MTEAAAIVHAATEHSLVLMDEIGRGTSTFDGLALASAIATHLHERNRAFTLFATHYFVLTEFARKHERARNVHVAAAETRRGGAVDIAFLHEIQPGPASRSYGVQVARLAGMPAGLLRQARATLEALEAKAQAGSAQIDLFAPAPVAEPHEEAAAAADARPARASALELALAAIDPDMLSPKQALDALYRLKSEASRGNPP
jgi:DNA mismatch repair protein MutS